MNASILLAQAGDGGPVKEIARTFGVDLPHLGAQILSFSIVCFLLHRYAYRPVLTMLAARRQEIAEGLANADKIKAEVARTEASRKEILNQANDQATKLIEEARALAAQVQERETQKAIAAAEQIIAKAREAAAADHARMLAELKREVGMLVVQTTARVAGKVLTTEDQQRLIDETNRQLAA